MKAAVFTAPRQAVELEERQRPTPGRGEVLIRVRACGVCNGDLMLHQGVWPFARYPVVPGHEVAGVVETVGEDVAWPAPGTRIGVPALFSACGHCRQCLGGDEFFCAQRQHTGMTRDGGYQEYMLAPAAYVTPLPDALDFTDAAPLMCAGLSVFNALRQAGFEPGNKVAVVGLGGLGHLAVQFARAMGGRVAAISSRPEKAAEAHELGAERFINGESAAVSEALSDWEGGADIILITAPAVEPATAALAGLALGGTLILLGTGPGDLVVNPMGLILGRRRIMGSAAGSRKDLQDTLEFAATHGVRPRVTSFALAQVGEALQAMYEGRVHGRAVIVMD